MRLWSIHPRYLDAKGLVALWREALLAKAVLAGRTKGYRNHPQLARFKETADPGAAIRAYLEAVFDEARSRGYRFDARKLGRPRASGPAGAAVKTTSGTPRISVTRGQLAYEWKHLMAKLALRDPERRAALAADTARGIDAHPLFRVVHGEVEEWEVGAR